MKLTLKKGAVVLASLFGFLCLLSSYAFAGKVNLPITIDYSFLRSLALYAAFTDTGKTAQVLNVNNGCRKIILSDPHYSAEKSYICLDTKVHVRAGTFQKAKCIDPVEWEGYLHLTQIPKIDNRQWMLTFETADTTILDMNHQPAKPPDAIRELIEVWAYDYLDNFSINLAPPLSQVKELLHELFPPDLVFLAEKMMYSMTVGNVSPDPDALRVYVMVETDDVYAVKKDLQKKLSSKEDIEKTTELWHAWDSFLVYILDALICKRLSDDDRQIVMDTLLETRHSFVSEMSNKTLTKNFVREEFTMAWEQLSPVFRKNLGDEPCRNLSSYLAFFTVADALVAFDKVIFDLGIEMNRNTLIFLARLLSKGKPVSLDYQPDIDKKLRKIIGIQPFPEKPDPPCKSDNMKKSRSEHTIIKTNQKFLYSTFASLLCSTAWAQESIPAKKDDEIEQWIFSPEELDAYLERIRNLLHDISDHMLENTTIPDHYYELYRHIVLATAWQESCFRQFKIKNGEVVYLRSYNDTSVGLMQINETVWRGMYDREKLRWDIAYNAEVGCRIIDLYLTRYALRRMKSLNFKKPLENDTLAQIVYAMYNGGPRQFYNFLKRNKREQLYLSDSLFWDKYIWVKNGEWDNVRKCLIGG
jgi:hypothetical protein